MKGDKDLSMKERLDRYTKPVKNGCIEWTASTAGAGYGQVRIKGQGYLTHRLSWMVNNGAIPKGLRVLHKCDNKLCVNPKHLFLGTQADNIRDMMQKGRRGYTGLPGARHHKAKLTEADVLRIRRLLSETDITRAELTRVYRVSKSTIDHVANRTTWQHI